MTTGQKFSNDFIHCRVGGRGDEDARQRIIGVTFSPAKNDLKDHGSYGSRFAYDKETLNYRLLGERSELLANKTYSYRFQEDLE